MCLEKFSEIVQNMKFGQEELFLLENSKYLESFIYSGVLFQV
jgi:hypothetical protein